MRKGLRFESFVDPNYVSYGESKPIYTTTILRNVEINTHHVSQLDAFERISDPVARLNLLLNWPLASHWKYTQHAIVSLAQYGVSDTAHHLCPRPWWLRFTFTPLPKNIKDSRQQHILSAWVEETPSTENAVRLLPVRIGGFFNIPERLTSLEVDLVTCAYETKWELAWP